MNQLIHLYEQMKNMPDMYHNGGLWPMLIGLEEMGLVSHGAWERARHLLTAINTANAMGSENSSGILLNIITVKHICPWERNTWPGVPGLAYSLIKRYGVESRAGRYKDLL